MDITFEVGNILFLTCLSRPILVKYVLTKHNFNLRILLPAAKHARRMKALGLSFEHPRESVLSNYGTYHAESDATKDKEVEKKETTAESEDGEAEKPSEEGLGGS